MSYSKYGTEIDILKEKIKNMNFMIPEFFDDYLKDVSLIQMLSAKTKDGNLEIEISAPGYEKDEIELSIDGNYILLSAKENYRSFYIDRLTNVDISNTKASLDKGILKIKIPIKNQSKIEIK